MRGKTLTSLLDDYRIEVRASTNPALNSGVYNRQVALLQRVQESLWEDHDWGHLRVERFIDVQAGQRYYDPLGAVDKDGNVPSDLLIDNIEKIEIRDGDRWITLTPGIDQNHYNQWDSDKDQRSWPAVRWQMYEGEQIELWPIPEANADTVSLDGRMKLTGIRKLRPLVAPGDTCDLDGKMIVLFAAAEELANAKAADAQLKLSAAQKLYAKLAGKLKKRAPFKMFGAGREPRKELRGPPTVYYRTTP